MFNNHLRQLKSLSEGRSAEIMEFRSVLRNAKFSFQAKKKQQQSFGEFHEKINLFLSCLSIFFKEFPVRLNNVNLLRQQLFTNFRASMCMAWGILKP